MAKGATGFRKVTQVNLTGDTGVDRGQTVILYGREDDGRPTKTELTFEDAARLAHHLLGWCRKYRPDLVECPHKQVWLGGLCATCRENVQK